MSGPEKRAREEEAAGDAAPPGAHETPTLLDVAWIVAKNGYAADVWRCSGICREMWRWIAPELSEEDAARVRRDHPFWQAIIDLPHGPNGETRLMLAVLFGARARVKALIAWHANVNMANTNGATALMAACVAGRDKIVRALLAAGASVIAAASDGCTALILASDSGHVEVVRALLAAGADVDAVNDLGWTALICASNKGHVEVVRALLAAGANKHLVDINGDTAHSIATLKVFDLWDGPASSEAICALLVLAP